MKKRFFIVLALTMVLCLALVSAAYAGNKTIVLKIGDPMMTVNGLTKEIDPGRGTKPVVINGSTLVPIKAIIDEMGGTTAWDGGLRQVTIVVGTKTIKLTLDVSAAVIKDSANAVDNWENKSLPVAPRSINGRTMVPLRFVSENLGATVGWDGATKQVTINCAAVAFDPLNWTGAWTSDTGNIVLTQSGNIVTGNDDSGYWGKINGTVSGTTFTGTWFLSVEDQGDLEMILADDGKSFTTRWRYNAPGRRPDPADETGGWVDGSAAMRNS